MGYNRDARAHIDLQMHQRRFVWECISRPITVTGFVQMGTLRILGDTLSQYGGCKQSTSVILHSLETERTVVENAIGNLNLLDLG